MNINDIRNKIKQFNAARAAKEAELEKLRKDAEAAEADMDAAMLADNQSEYIKKGSSLASIQQRIGFIEGYLHRSSGSAVTDAEILDAWNDFCMKYNSGFVGKWKAYEAERKKCIAKFKELLSDQEQAIQIHNELQQLISDPEIGADYDLLDTIPTRTESTPVNIWHASFDAMMLFTELLEGSQEPSPTPVDGRQISELDGRLWRTLRGFRSSF